MEGLNQVESSSWLYVAGWCTFAPLLWLLATPHGRCSSKARLDGKTALVTGSNTGIGKETAMDFYKRGARVIMACRDIEKARRAKQAIEDTCKNLSGLGSLVVIKLDLASLKSVRQCAQLILATEPQLNILVNNAGVMMCPEGRTEDGFETQFGSNHLGHFLLTLLLLPKIRNSTPARIVTVASVAHIVLLSLKWDDLNSRKGYNSVQAYALSKAANILASRELAQRLKEHRIEGINTYCVHPGIVASDLGRHLGSIFPGLSWLWYHLWPGIAKTTLQGAQTTIYCAVDERCAGETGLYYSDCAEKKPWTYSRSNENARKMWEKSMELVGLGDYDPFTVQDAGTKSCATLAHAKVACEDIIFF